MAGAKTPAKAGKAPEWIGPYLQNPAPDGMTVCFLTPGEDGQVSVLHGVNDLKNELKAVGTPVPGTPWTVWKARITGLKPGAKHRYRVEWRDGGGKPLQKSEETTFTTPDPGADRVRMIVVNDIHNRVGTLAALMRHVRPEDYEFSVLLGDCWTDPNPKDGASKVFLTLEACVRLLDAAAKPMLFVRGNHETRGGFSDRMAMLFDIPGLDATKKKDEQQWWWSLRDGPVFFIAADTGEDDGFATPENSYKRPKFWQSYRKRETPWLEGLFKKNAAGDASWKVFLSHIPLYNPAGANSEPSRVYWESVLRKGGIDLMCAGHVHTWELVSKGKSWSRTVRAKDGPKKKETRTAPWPILIGGGPAEKQGTVMLVEATRKQLSARLLDTKGKVLTKFSKEKGK
jgi:hypothetical protein